MKRIQEQIWRLLNEKERVIVRKLDIPQKVQDFLDKLPFNFEERRETYYSPRKMLRKGKCHCFEGALFAYLCLKYHGLEAYILDLKVKDRFRKSGVESDHAICIFKQGGRWGAISKTNHSVLRWRDPIYISVREVAVTYFHEYFLDSGEKTLRSYSKPFDVFKKFGYRWIIDEDDLDHIAEALDRSPHFLFVPKSSEKFLRKAGKTEIKGASIVEWNRKKR